jgi:3-hydroxyisobutyrate dehydrogenase-like beta-hydroxyacid dehydrogenase
MRNTVKLAFVGFGEVGRTFARGLLATPGVEIAAYDILFDDPARARDKRDAARAQGVSPAADAASASAGASIVISAVTAAVAGEVAAQAARYLEPGQIFFDVNSASPDTKKRAAAAVEACGARYVEGAVMAPVLAPGIKVPILAGGPAAAELAATLNALGMNIDPVTVEPGRASAMKLCRSIVIKGLEAILCDMTAASRAWGVEDQVIASLTASYPALDWRAMAENMGERVRTHGVRRAAEMREAAAMLEDLGLDPTLSSAIADRHERIAKAAMR